MKKALFIIALISSIASCKKSNCDIEVTPSAYDINTFPDSTAFISLMGPVSPVNNSGCTFEITEEPSNGSAYILDSIGINYIANADFNGNDVLTYIDYWCHEVTVDIKVWPTPGDYCLDVFNNLPHCREIKLTTSSSAISTTLGYRPINRRCYDFIESIEIVTEPTIGTVEFEGEYLQYTFPPTEREDKFIIQLCLDIDNTIHCKERTWFFDVKLS